MACLRMTPKVVCTLASLHTCVPAQTHPGIKTFIRIQSATESSDITEASFYTTADLSSIGGVKPFNTCIAKHFELVLYQRCPDLLAY